MRPAVCCSQWFRQACQWLPVHLILLMLICMQRIKVSLQPHLWQDGYKYHPWNTQTLLLNANTYWPQTLASDLTSADQQMFSMNLRAMRGTLQQLWLSLVAWYLMISTILRCMYLCKAVQKSTKDKTPLAAVPAISSSSISKII